MTNGTSQGLLVIVAVIIFGIFVGIVYQIFGFQMREAVGGVFDDAIVQTLEDINPTLMSEYLVSQYPVRYRNSASTQSRLTQTEIIEDTKDKLHVLYDVKWDNPNAHSSSIYQVKLANSGIEFVSSKFKQISTDGENWSVFRDRNGQPRLAVLYDFQSSRQYDIVNDYIYYLKDENDKIYTIQVTLDLSKNY